MILDAASTLYGAVAAWRRGRYTEASGRQRRLGRPVISVGNINSGGSGKTPVVALLARLLLGAGERPAILTRGYARKVESKGVTVVSDGATIRCNVDHAGDEPLMLARALPGVAVLVAADRYLAGRMAESQFGATVHLLDDGFQHLGLARDVDLLMVSAADLNDRVIPAGRLREPLATASLADAVIVGPSSPAAAMDPGAVARALGVGEAFSVQRWTLGPPPALLGTPVFAFAGIARPERFVNDLEAAGWTVAGSLTFRDHHRFTADDMKRIADSAGAAGASAVVTTEKDAVRFEACDLGPLPITAVPLVVRIEPAERFTSWLLQRLRSVRGTEPSPVKTFVPTVPSPSR